MTPLNQGLGRERLESYPIDLRKQFAIFTRWQVAPYMRDLIIRDIVALCARGCFANLNLSRRVTLQTSRHTIQHTIKHQATTLIKGKIYIAKILYQYRSLSIIINHIIMSNWRHKIQIMYNPTCGDLQTSRRPLDPLHMDNTVSILTSIYEWDAT